MSKANTHQSTIQNSDAILACVIYGAMFQIAAFSITKIWLMYIPIAAPFAFYYTYVLSLYAAHIAPKLLTMDSKSEKLGDIVNYLFSLTAQVYSYLTTNTPTDQTAGFQSSTQALKYLAAALAIYNIPAILGLIITYVIICLSHGREHAKLILNLPVFLLSTLYGLCISYMNTPLWFGLMATNVAILYVLAPNTQDTKDTCDDMLENLYVTAERSLKSLAGKTIDPESSLEDKTLYTLIAIALVMPATAVIPYVSAIPCHLFSPSMLAIQSAISTLVLGSKIRMFMPALSNETTPPIPAEEFDIVTQAGKQFVSAINTVISNFSTKEKTA